MTYQQFWDLVLAHLGIQPTKGNRRAFGVIVLIEGRNRYSNPMNWVLPDHYPKYNTTGVREYPDPATGARETASNLANNSRWQPFVKSLRDATTRIGPLRALAKIYATWGSFPRFFAVSYLSAAAVLKEQMPS